MAKATKAAADYEVTLTLNGREAETLRAIIGSIAGTSRSPRKFADEIYYAMVNAGIPPRGFPTGSILFEDGNME